jgi:hypothetical protein
MAIKFMAGSAYLDPSDPTVNLSGSEIKRVRPDRVKGRAGLVRV